MTLLRVLTTIGNKEFINYIIDLKKDATIPIPLHLLEQSPFSETFKPEISIENRIFLNRIELGAYLCSIFDNYSRDILIKNEGLWNWLSLFWINQLIPIDSSGKRIVGEMARYAYNPHFTRFYRHIIAGSWDIYDKYRDDSKLFLYTPVNKTSQFILDLACRQNMISNRNLIKVVQLLYWQSYGDGQEGIKKGAVTKNKPGNLSRFIAILNQLDTTYDLYAMEPEKIISLLPAEFNSWRLKKMKKGIKEKFQFGHHNKRAII